MKNQSLRKWSNT